MSNEAIRQIERIAEVAGHMKCLDGEKVSMKAARVMGELAAYQAIANDAQDQINSLQRQLDAKELNNETE